MAAAILFSLKNLLNINDSALQILFVLYAYTIFLFSDKQHGYSDKFTLCLKCYGELLNGSGASAVVSDTKEIPAASAGIMYV